VSGSLVITVLQLLLSVPVNNFKNWFLFGRDMDKSIVFFRVMMYYCSVIIWLHKDVGYVVWVKCVWSLVFQLDLIVFYLLHHLIYSCAVKCWFDVYSLCNCCKFAAVTLMHLPVNLLLHMRVCNSMAKQDVHCVSEKPGMQYYAS